MDEIANEKEHLGPLTWRIGERREIKASQDSDSRRTSEGTTMKRLPSEPWNVIIQIAPSSHLLTTSFLLDRNCPPRNEAPLREDCVQSAVIVWMSTRNCNSEESEKERERKVLRLLQTLPDGNWCRKEAIPLFNRICCIVADNTRGQILVIIPLVQEGLKEHSYENKSLWHNYKMTIETWCSLL